MSENRSRYSSAPLQDLRRRPPRPAPSRAPVNAGPQGNAGQGSFVLLQVMLVAVLPLAFLAALIIKNTTFYWAFVIASLVSVLAMYLLRAFVPNARKVLGVIHTAMMVVILFSIVVSGAGPDDRRTQTAQDLQSIFNDETTKSIVDMNTAQGGEAEANEPNPGAASLAQQKLDQFMAAWATKDYPAMVSYSAPNWVNQFETQREAETSIFHLSAIRTPVSYEVKEVSGNDSDQTRTISMQASISKNDGKEPQLYNFQILMIRNNNQWYVDPNSISSSQVVQQAVAQQAVSEEADQQAGSINLDSQSGVAVPQITGVRSDTLLYYNQDGGEYYHIDPNCSSIGARYKPLTATFYYRDVSNDTFKNLKTCPYCKAPARP